MMPINMINIIILFIHFPLKVVDRLLYPICCAILISLIKEKSPTGGAK